MTDDLRTRIAAVLYRLWRERFPRSDRWEELADDEREPWLTDADAVIRELGLKRTDGPLKSTPVHRYVTEWMPNND